MTLPKDHPAACPRCWGDGRVADCETGEPWPAWLEMPLQSSLAVIMGIVKPKACPECGGSGVRAAPRTLEDLNEQLDALSDAEKEDFVKMLRQLEARGKA